MRLKEYIDDFRIVQTDLANFLKIKPSSLSYFVTGRVPIPVYKWPLIVEATNGHVSFMDLYHQTLEYYEKKGKVKNVDAHLGSQGQLPLRSHRKRRKTSSPQERNLSCPDKGLESGTEGV